MNVDTDESHSKFAFVPGGGLHDYGMLQLTSYSA